MEEFLQGVTLIAAINVAAVALAVIAGFYSIIPERYWATLTLGLFGAGLTLGAGLIMGQDVVYWLAPLTASVPVIMGSLTYFMPQHQRQLEGLMSGDEVF